MRLRADVAVIGAGPAGAAAAVTLARGGARVVLCDRAVFPRDKVCGDGLLPDALALLAQLGVEEAQSAGWSVGSVCFRTKGGVELSLPVPARVLHRHRLDNGLVAAAAAAGAKVLGGASLTQGASRAGGIETVTLARGEEVVEVAAEAYVVATGAGGGARRMLGLPPLPPSAVAVRGYGELDRLAPEALWISLDGAPAGGYAWAFPVSATQWNVGCGVFFGPGQGHVLRASLASFSAACGGRGLAEVRGAPLATAYPRVVVGRGNVLAVGDAAGLARPLSGEGVGPALESGVLAARCLLAHPGAAGVAAYRTQLRARFAREQQAWRLGERLLRVPRLLEVLFASAASSPPVQRRLALVLEGRAPARSVLSPLGLLRIYLGR
ncbi:MAG: geranylgeranyl reductase family protein [Thermoanaerobaculaceae bacterium]|nr:geranylgeranyl reductase family protein [Thermoanaerobaculaceae bacterium]